MTTWTSNEIDELRKLAAEGASLMRASARLGRSSAGVKRKAKEFGIEFKTTAQARSAGGLQTRWSGNRDY